MRLLHANGARESRVWPDLLENAELPNCKQYMYANKALLTIGSACVVQLHVAEEAYVEAGISGKLGRAAKQKPSVHALPRTT